MLSGRQIKLKFQNSQKGFTLIEMLVVVVVVGIGIIGALSFFNINLNNQFEAKNELIAAELAQEGTDLVRNIRDYNLIEGNAWDLNLGGCSAIDYNSLSSHQCSNSGAAVCISDSSSRYYQCAGGNTVFTRTVSVGAVNPDGSRKVTCTVTWNGRTTSATEVLYATRF